MKKDNRRLKKINNLIKEIVMGILEREVSDPRISLITISEVDTAPDLKTCKIFYSVYGSEEEKKYTSEALKKASGFIQVKFSEQVSFKYTPKLSFVYDNTLDKVEKLNNIFKRLKNESRDE
ncbi:MAG: 30S ribosome-binding factor RbfA [Candidatus Muiribacteriota bacterium]